MEYREVIYLITNRQNDQDEIGNHTLKPILEKSLAKKNIVGSKEFYNGVQAGLKPEHEFQIKKSNYNGQTEIKYLDDVYGVIRTIDKNEDVVLVVQRKIGASDV